MDDRVKLVRACLAGALLSGVGLFASGALAQSAGQTEPVPYWWFSGNVEAGGRFFLNNPPRNGSNYLGQSSLAKYYEYSTIAPGPFGNAYLSAGSRDGLYRIDFGASNIGYSDQSYYLDYSQVGKQYLSLGWDQTPHVYSTSAQTFYQGVGSNNLTLPPGFVPSVGAGIPASITPFLHQTDLGIQRDTASVNYRWTPTDAWDIRADYSNLRRTGTQVDGVVGFGPSFPYGPTQVPRPVSDSTQNYGMNGEYMGASPWGQTYTFKLAYNGSQYTDDFSSYTVQDPISTGVTPIAQLSTWPSNRADAVSGTLGADLPWKSRYAGTLSYSMMRQNDSFIPMTAFPGAIMTPVTTLPASSLNGAINTVLSNNVITTKLTPELTSKASYRYYDFINNTPELNFANGWIGLDRNPATTAPEIAMTSLAMAYTKQNAGEELNWRPSKEWNLGAAYGYERYNWTRADADVTNEHSGKLFADWKPATWFSTRSSISYARRRYENYDYYQFVANTQYDGAAAANGYSTSYRQLMIDNRDRWRANLAADIELIHGLTLTPTFQYGDDNYGLDPSTEDGLRDSRSWDAGIDATYLFDPGLSVTVGYLREYSTQLVYNCNCDTHGAPSTTPTPANFMETTDRTTVDTFTALVRYAAIPNKLDLSLRYALSHGIDHQQLIQASGAAPTGGQFPDVTTWFQRLDATAVYTFDKQTVASMGWRGNVKAKLHYVWERNSVSDWSSDGLALYDPTFESGANAIFMAYGNPNYNVHMLMTSLAFSW
jgi:MtrB/PioB family decaheme-associated outer membrane protein